MKSYEITYVNNKVLGHFDNGLYLPYNKDEKEKLLNEIENDIKIKDRNRKLCSLIIGIFLLIIAVLIMFLMIFKIINLGNGEWFNYTFVILGLVAVWVLFYFISGLIFYNKECLNFHFKGYGNAAEGYLSTNYAKWVEKYKDYLGKVTFLKDNKKKELITFALSIPSPFKNIIFNGKINANIPYYYLSYKATRYLFLPGMLIIVDYTKSKVISIDKIKIKKDGDNYHLMCEDQELINITVNAEFDVNFFYFNY